MKVKLINGSPDPEKLVCTAARNDYRSEGVIGHSFRNIMEKIDGKNHNVVEEWPDYYNKWGSMYANKMMTLIDHLMDSGHWGPFEHPQAVVAIEGVTRVVTHQIVRHRHFSYDQQSMRFVNVDPVSVTEQFQIPEFRGEDFDVDREGVKEIENMDRVKGLFEHSYQNSLEYYRDLLDEGVPREKARKVLPTGTKTNIVMSGNTRAWMHILMVRKKADVQKETRDCANKILEELKGWMPYTFEKYDDKLPMKLGP